MVLPTSYSQIRYWDTKRKSEAQKCMKLTIICRFSLHLYGNWALRLGGKQLCSREQLHFPFGASDWIKYLHLSSLLLKKQNKKNILPAWCIYFDACSHHRGTRNSISTLYWPLPSFAFFPFRDTTCVWAASSLQLQPGFTCWGWTPPFLGALRTGWDAPSALRHQR